MQPFALDRSNSKLMGVCAGVARATGADVTLVRIGTLLSLFLIGPVTILLYFATAWVAPERI
jgi:phage shock protein C